MNRLSTAVIAIAIAALSFAAGYQFATGNRENAEIQRQTSNIDPIQDGQPPIELSFPVPEITRESQFEQQLAVTLTASETVSAQTIEDHLKRQLSSKDHFQHHDLALVLLRRLVDLDRDAALGVLLTPLADKHRGELMIAMGSAIANQNPNEAVAFALSQQEPYRSELLAHLTLDHAVVSAGLDAGLESQLNPGARVKLDALRKSRQDPSDRFLAAQQLTGQTRIVELSSAFVALWQEDPRAAEQALLRHENSEERQYLFAALLGDVMQNGGDVFSLYELLRWETDIAPGTDHNALQFMMVQDPDRALPLLEESYASNNDIYMFASAIGMWATRDRDRAMEYAASHGPEVLQHAINTYTMSALQTNANEAMEWIMANGSDQVKQSALSMLPQRNPALAASWFDRLIDDDVSTRLMSNIAGSKARENPEEALTWLQRYQDHPGYPNALMRVAMRDFRNNPDRYVDLIRDHAADQQYARTFAHIGANYADIAPQKALAWLSDLPDGPGKLGATGGVMLTAAARAPDVSLELFGSLSSNEKQKTRIQLASQLVRLHPARKDEFLSTLSVKESELQIPQQMFGIDGAGTIMGFPATSTRTITAGAVTN